MVIYLSKIIFKYNKYASFSLKPSKRKKESKILKLDIVNLLGNYERYAAYVRQTRLISIGFYLQR
ncbi:hypothetical protein LguiA_018710 [Lonicera macranthoides]